MKKFLLLLAVAVAGVSTVMAQRAGELNVWQGDQNDWNHSGVFADGGLGLFCGDTDTNFGIEVNVGYRWHLYEGLCWDVVKGGIQLYCSDIIADASTARFLSGLHYNSPRFIADKSLYISTAFGYQFMWGDTEMGGLAYEVGAGINLTPNFSAGINWSGNNTKYDYYLFSGTSKWGLLSLRFSYQF